MSNEQYSHEAYARIISNELALDIVDENQESLLDDYFLVGDKSDEDILEFLDEWFPGMIGDAEKFSVAAMNDYIHDFEGDITELNVNQALRNNQYHFYHS